ncbi:Os03g0369401 [Oryza sativa Japonica Group]|uniref:Os03g0369401 protein n=1 Tax=Oryza sativa subsp. japonica TaxID=39947 RepID=A0A0N7KHB5_ORYSJ|nr:Os03g0369401 [Oryza sativa Japonica Group]
MPLGLAVWYMVASLPHPLDVRVCTGEEIRMGEVGAKECGGGRIYGCPLPRVSSAGNPWSGSIAPSRESGSHRIITECSNKSLSTKHLCPSTRDTDDACASSLIGTTLVMPWRVDMEDLHFTTGGSEVG